jgi:hypothetical protein
MGGKGGAFTPPGRLGVDDAEPAKLPLRDFEYEGESDCCGDCMPGE